MRDSGKELPPGVMRAVASLSREQDLDFRISTRPWRLLCTCPQGYPVNSIKLRASRWISPEYRGERLQGSTMKTKLLWP